MPKVLGDFRGTMAPVTQRFVSIGHAQRYEAIVWANETARAAWEGAGDFADGSKLVEELAGAGALGMEKRDGAWKWSAVGSGEEVADDARLRACRECHRDAPRDDVFRVR